MNRIILMVIILASQMSYAQIKPKKTVSKTIYPALKVGEKVPDISLGEIVNYSMGISTDKKTLKVSDFKGKLLLLDFWGAFCGSCIAAFPKLEKLQKQFGSEIRILPISFGIRKSDGKVTRSVVPLIKSWKGTAREMRLPSTEVIEHQNGLQVHVLRQLFPFDSFPTIIWIDQNGIFRGTTESAALTLNNIKDVLNNNHKSFKQKVILTGIDTSKSFLINRIKKDNIPAYGSAFCKYVDTLNWSYLTLDTSDRRFYRFYAVNWSVEALYESAYQKSPNAELWRADNQNILIDPASKPFYRNDAEMNRLDYWKKDSVYADNRFCYEAIYPKANCSVTDAWGKVVKDLDNYLGVQSKIDNREVACLMLVRTNPDQIPVAFGQKLSVDELYKANSNKQIIVTGHEVGHFLQILKASLELISPHLAIISNQTGYNGGIQILFNEGDLESLDSVKTALQKNGLDLVAGTAKMNVLVLKRVR